MSGLEIRRRFFAPTTRFKKTFQARIEGLKKGQDGKPELDPKTGKPKKEVIFQMADVQAPDPWTQHAVDIAASKYFVKARVPNDRGHEYSVYDMCERVAKTIRQSGEEQGGYFDYPASADAFEVELCEILLSQRAAFNSPVWFNVGLWHQYGIEGNGVNYAWNPATMKVETVKRYYERPQASACFIQPVQDSLASIFELVQAESRVFKGGSGTGTNFSPLRSRFEPLAGGGLSSGLMSFLDVFDRGAGSIKSGGTTRRAAKMVVVDADHPEIFDFVRWKADEEKKAKALIAAGYDSDFNGEAYQTVSGQNSNNSVRVTDEFMRAVERDEGWSTTYRTTGGVHETFPARKLWQAIAEAAWACADPGIQYDTTIQHWHTVPKTGRINASNPCAEFLHVDDSACNLASINLLKFLREDGSFDLPGFAHTCRILTVAMDILVDLSSYPTPSIAANSHHLRPLGLGYANLGAMLIALGLPYDSEEARTWAAAITSLMTAVSYRASSELAEAKAPFAEFGKNRSDMLRVIAQHADANEAVRLAAERRGRDLGFVVLEALNEWKECLRLGGQHGFRNAQISLLAPTGTISFLMGCDTTGVEPDFSIVKHKKLAGGGDMVIVNATVERGLRRLGYSAEQAGKILTHMRDTGGAEGAPELKPEHLPVFDCAAPAGPSGRCIEPMGHLAMIAAVQPFLSGAVSKTVNVPSETTAEQIAALYTAGWKMGLKAVAIYRDGCKLSQPLNAGAPKAPKHTATARFTKLEAELAEAHNESAYHEERAASLAAKLTFREAELAKLKAGKSAQATKRHRLPLRRMGFTQEARVGGQKIYLRTGEYEDGRLGEIFIDMHKQGSMMRSLMNSFAISVSLGLQHGVPLEEYVDVFTFTRFEPAGITDHAQVRQATSVLDFLFRVLGIEYLGRTELGHIQPPEPLAVADRPLRQGQETELAELAVATPAEVVDLVQRTRELNGHAAPGSPAKLQADAPLCPQCGELTVRNAACYKCLNCGESLGCS